MSPLLQLENNVTVYCRSGDLPEELRSGMTGYARIYTGRLPIGEVLVIKLLRIVRTEFWFFW